MPVLLLVAGVLFACTASKPARLDTNEVATAEVSSARTAFLAGNYSEAARLFQPVVETSATPSRDLLFHYAESLRLSGEIARAVIVYERLQTLDPTMLEAQEGKALCALAQGRTDLAVELLTSIIQQDASRWRTINALGITHALLGHNEEALEYFAMAKDLSNHQPAVSHNEALAFAIAKRYPEAETMLRALLLELKSENPARKNIAFSLALVLGLQDKMQEAEDMLTPYLSAPAISNNLGVYASLRDHQALAQSYFSQAVSQSPVFYQRAWENQQR